MTARYRRATEVAITGESAEPGSRVVLLALAAHESAAPIALEGSAALIWHEVPQATSEGLDSTTIANAVAEAANVDAAAIAADVEAFLCELAQLRLAERLSDDA